MKSPSRHRSERGRQSFVPVVTPVGLAVWMLAAPSAWALPTGAVPTFGDARIGGSGGTTLDIVQASAKAGIDWRSFSIAAGERVLVRQPDAQSVLFNRVTGGDPSLILGQMQANGRVFLSNPRGIIFGAGSQVDVGGLVATTLELANPLDPGRYLLRRGTAEPGVLRADGDIRAPQGTVALVGPSLSVGGNVLAGRVGLAAVGSVEVDVEGDGRIFFNARDEGLAARLALLGSVQALGGSAELRAAARAGFADTVLNLEGIVRARGLGQREGRVVIDGGSAGLTRIAGGVDVRGADGGRGGEIAVQGARVTVTPTASLDASGEAGGGAVRVGAASAALPPSDPAAAAADGDTVVAGRIVASGDGTGAVGGTVQVVGRRVGLLGQASIDASGTAGGGVVQIGGELHGGGSLPRATSTVLSAGSVVGAPARARGDGGPGRGGADGATRLDAAH